MKRYLAGMAVVVMAAGMAVGTAVAGQTQAEREMARGKTVASGVATRVLTPDVNDCECRTAMETGNLPSECGTLKSGGALQGAVPMVEIGGLVYRIGIDTP